MSDLNVKNQPSSDDGLENARSRMTLSPEQFEQMFLGPKTAVHGKLRQTFGNPTPIALGGFLLSTTPLSMVLLEWAGSGGLGAPANVGSYFFLGGMLLVLGGIGEWLLGNTFPATVFSTFGGFWLTFGATLVPSYGAYGAYSTTGTPADGLDEPQFYATFAFLLAAMTFLCALYTIASIRTNVVLFSILLSLVPCFGCLSASFFAVSNGQAEAALTIQHAAGGLLLVTSILGWYIFSALLLLSVEFPFNLPLGDLSSVIKPKAS